MSRYIVPGSDAATKDIQRGAIWYQRNPRFTNLYANGTLNFADYNAGQLPNNKTVLALTKTVLAENPILIRKVITNGTHKIGYLMYNGFMQIMTIS
jgi:hypothetical protein